MTQQTPRSWKVVDHFDAMGTSWYDVQDADGLRVALVDATPDDRSGNAALIAAAPLLLNALRGFPCGVQHNLCSTATREERIQYIEAVIRWHNEELLPALQAAAEEG